MAARISNFHFVPFRRRKKHCLSLGLLLIGALLGALPVSSEPVAGALPVVIVYIPPEKADGSGRLTNQQVADTFRVVIYHRDRLLDTVPGYKAVGFKGTVAQYLILNSFMAPTTLHDAASQTRYCNGAEWAYVPWNNHVTMEVGDFCRIHDSVVGGRNNDAGKKFDHDLNPNTPAIWASEDWFLHHPDTGYRIVEANQQQYYRPNPGHPHVREYFAARIRREFLGGLRVNGAVHPPAGADVLFLDNVELSWNKVLRDGGLQGSGRGPREYATSNAYADAVFGFVQALYNATHSGGLQVPLWGNMIEGGDHVDNLWDRYRPLLDGAMNESYSLFWGQRPLTLTELENQMRQADTWIAGGNHFMAVVQGTAGAQRDQWNRYALAAYYLVADAGQGSYYYDPHVAQYTRFYDYPEYDLALGRPLATRRRLSSPDVVFRRDFECGFVEVNVTKTLGTLSQASGCTPGSGGPPLPPRSLRRR